jgi:hypothetical protein
VANDSCQVKKGKTARRSLKKNTYVYTICLLGEVFSRLFAGVRKLEKTSLRDELEDRIRKELRVLEKTQTGPDARPLYSSNKEILQALHILQGSKLPTELVNLGTTRPQLKRSLPTRPNRANGFGSRARMVDLPPSKT